MKLNNTKIKFLLLLRFFFFTNGGKFRKTYFFQIIGLYLGALIISLTFSIMGGMESQIFDKVESFNYKYIIKQSLDNDISDEFIDNRGKKSLVRCETKSYDFLINVITYDKLNDFVQDKIREDLLYENNLYNKSSIIIGKSLSAKYGISIGDTITLSDIANVNVVTGNYLSEIFIVANVFKFQFLNFDSENVFIMESHASFLKSENYNFYTDNLQKNKVLGHDSKFPDFGDALISSDSEYSLLISSIKFEKKLYILLGVLTIIISSIMIFNNTLIVLLEKKKQFKLLDSLGMSLNKMLLIMLFCNVLMSLFLSGLGLLTTFFIEKLNIWFNVIDYLFIYSPFETIPMNLSINQSIMTLLLIIILTTISTILSINNMKYRLEEE